MRRIVPAWRRLAPSDVRSLKWQLAAAITLTVFTAPDVLGGIGNRWDWVAVAGAVLVSIDAVWRLHLHRRVGPEGLAARPPRARVR